MKSIPSRLFFLCLFLFLLAMRTFTELPRSLSETGLGDLHDGNGNRILSSMLLFSTVLYSVTLVNRRFTRHQLVMGVLFLLVLILSSFNAWITFTHVGMSYEGIIVVLMRLLLGFFIILLAWNAITSKSDVRLLFQIYLKPVVWITIIITFIQIFTSTYVSVQGVDRIMGPFGNPNTLAAFLHLTIMLTIVSRKFGFDRSGSIFWVLIGLQYILLLYTGSVTNIGINLVFLLCLFVSDRWYKLKAFYLGAFLFIIIVPLSVAYKWPSIEYRLSKLVDIETMEIPSASSLQWRAEAWRHYSSLIDNPRKLLTGLGLGTQRSIFLVDYPGNRSTEFEAPGTHNDYMAMIVDFGLIGLALFLIACRYLTRTLKRHEHTLPIIKYFRFYFYSIMFAMLMENYFDQFTAYLFLLYAVAFIKFAQLTKNDIIHNAQEIQDHAV